MGFQSFSKTISSLLLTLLLLAILDPACCFRANANANGGGTAKGGAIQPQQSPSSLPTTMPTAAPSSTALSASIDNKEETSASIGSMDGLSVGFLGCGTIASSIARGLTKAANSESKLSIHNMVVSERSISKSQALIEDLSPTVQISSTTNNQAILDACQVIFLTVLPQQAEEVLQQLEFDPNKHILVSLVSTANLQDLVRDSKLNLSRVAKMICLPSIANHEGVALLCCGDDGSQAATNTKEFLTQLFQSMGGVVCLETEADLEACMVTTCTMGPLYGTMKNQRDWLLQKTESLSKTDATTLVIQQFAGAVGDAFKKIHENRLEDLIEEQTPGGLNEQALKNYGKVLRGFADLQDPVMDAILSRIRGETDGSINATNE